MMSISQNLSQIRQRVNAAAKRVGRDPASIKLVAVSKTKSAALIREAYDAGQRVFGENYVQELSLKAKELSDLDIEWHLIGHLQRNKAKLVVNGIAWIETIDSFEIAQAIDQRANGPINTLIEVNIGGEATKSGVPAKEISLFVSPFHPLKHVIVRGLMCIPPYDPDPEKSRPFYRTMREILVSTSLHELSMGMSHDFEVAIEEGATMVRIGTAIFGERSTVERRSSCPS